LVDGTDAQNFPERIIIDGMLRTCQGGQITIDDNAIKAIVTGASFHPLDEVRHMQPNTSGGSSALAN
jgi:hypothetical protein